jgi:hypothetical protein
MPALADVNQAALRRSAGLHPLDAARVAALLLWGSLWMAGLLLAARRMAGALAAPLEPLPLLATGVAVAAIAAAGRLCWRRGATGRLHPTQSAAEVDVAEGSAPAASAAIRLLHTEAAERIGKVSVALSLVLIGLGLWLPATSMWGMAGFWLLVAGEEAWAASERRLSDAVQRPPRCEPAAAAEMSCESEAEGPVLSSPAEPAVAVAQSEPEPSSATTDWQLAGPHFLPQRPSPPSPPGKCDRPHAEPAAPHFDLRTAAEHEQDAEEAPLDEESGAGEQLLQQVTRTATAAGADVLRATLFAEFPAGSRTASVHVAFCPPFVCLPQAEFHQASGPSARIKLAQLLAHGARFDVKLSSAAAQRESVCIVLTAECDHLPS